MLSINLCGLRLSNPTILASGVLGSTGASLARVAKGGAGAVVTKSIGAAPREGHRNPTVVALDKSLLNSIGLANPGCENFGEELKIAKRAGVPVIGSVFGESVQEFAQVAKAMASYGCDAVELNLSCPNVEMLGSHFGQDAEMSAEVVREVKKSVSVPVIAKLTANVGDIVEVAQACEEAGCNAITAINTIKAMKIDIRAGKPVLGNRTGGLSGAAIKPIAIRCVYEIARETKLPVIGCGGVATGEDAVEFFLAGARAVEIGSAVYSRGINVFGKVAKEIEDYLRKNGYASVEEIIGLAP